MASSSGSIFSFFKKKKKEGRRGGPSSTRASASDPGWENPNDFRFLGTAGDIIQAPNWQEVAKFPLPKIPKGGASEAKSADYHEQVIAKPSAPQLALLMAGPKPKYVETELVTDASDPHAHHECTVCFDTKELFDFHVISGCAHPPICGQCLGLAIAEDINGKGKSLLQCPSTGCQMPLTTEDVIRCCSPANFDRFNHLCTMRWLESVPEFIRCTRPGCGFGAFHDGGADLNVFSCTSCRWLTCFTHREQLHLGVTCDGYDAWRDVAQSTGDANDEEALSVIKIQQTTKPCPLCRTRVEKNTDPEFAGDCDKLTCTRIISSGAQCGAEFCWFCQGQFFGGDPNNPERIRVYECGDPDHAKKYHNPRVPCGVGLHCHHAPGCIKMLPSGLIG